ncbi:MAG: glycosyltransferase, partial [Bacteroidota bacterium]
MAEKKKKVLIVTYYWPPGSGPGVQRFLKMSKFLYAFGWEPVILTVKNGSYPSTDPSLTKDIPEKLQIFKTKTIEPFSLYNKLTGGKGKQVGVGLIGFQHKTNLLKKISLFIRANIFLPDARRGWIPFAFKKAKYLHSKNKLHAVVTTGPPHSTHFIGLKLKKKFSLPWLVDMRDPWTNNFFNKALPRTRYTKKLEKKFEDKILTNADFITTVSPGLKKEFQDRNQNIQVIYNGYDQEDIPEPAQYKSSEFSLSYIGNLKPNQNIPALWKAIKEMEDEVEGF